MGPGEFCTDRRAALGVDDTDRRFPPGVESGRSGTCTDRRGVVDPCMADWLGRWGDLDDDIRGVVDPCMADWRGRWGDLDDDIRGVMGAPSMVRRFATGDFIAEGEAAA